MNYNAADIVGRLEELRHEKLSEYDQNNIEIWHKGRELAVTVATPGWQVALDLLQTYVVKSVEELIKTDPKYTDTVLSGHVISFVAGRLLTIFKQDVNSWVESSRQAPGIIKETIDSQKDLNL